MRKQILFVGLLCLCMISNGQTEQIAIPRIEKMPHIPQPYLLRDWKTITEQYVDLVFNEHEGEHFPLSFQEKAGMNYAQYNPIYMDTYVGWNSHGKGSEAINVMPAVISAYLTGCEERSRLELAQGVMDFYNVRNGENVYLNGFSSKSGKDWWYDVMPNVYFYQLYHLADLPDALAREQFISVADQWLGAVSGLGGNTFLWRLPDMNHRAYDLIAGKPLTSGVKEPESAGSIAWLLYHAYLETGERKYLKGAELSLEFLNSLTSNPSYELQLAYGVQVAAKMNALEGTDYDLEKMFNWCFDRGALRGWGCIVGRWGDYDVSGLIGEANDGGNDYAFVMNGFQQAAALAPVAKYDKRFARAYARWVLNLANASRLFYTDALPDTHQEQASLAWSRKYDANAVIPFESMKEKWEGTSPFAMGDALKGGWAATNLSLYSGSSVGYLAAVVESTDVEAILQLDLNQTDLDGRSKYPTYLYYNPYTEKRTVSVHLPAGSYRIYDAVSEVFLSEAVSGMYALTIPADGVRLLTLVPENVSLRQDGRLLYAGHCVIDYHAGNDFGSRLRIKNLEMQSSYLVKGQTAVARATVEHTTSSCTFAWEIDGDKVEKQLSSTIQFPADLSLGAHKLYVTVEDKGVSCRDSVEFFVLDTQVSVPEITGIQVEETMPVQPNSVVRASVQLKDPAQPTDIKWTINGGTIEDGIDSKDDVMWRLPDAEGIYTLTCTASTVRGSVSKDYEILVRSNDDDEVTPLLYFPFDDSLQDKVSGVVAAQYSGASPIFTNDAAGNPVKALQVKNNFFYLPNSDELNFRDAITISLWICPQQKNGAEQFLVSHGSWQDRYKLSINPDLTLRWTVKTASGVVDLDYSMPLTLNRFEHFCVIYTGFSLELYHNGLLDAYKSLTGDMGNTAENLTIGAMTMSEQAYNYQGVLDELYIFQQAVSPKQVKKLAYMEGVSHLTDMNTTIDFFVEDGYLRASEEVEHFRVYSLFGIDFTGQRLPSGTYLVRYWKNGHRYSSKFLVL